ncbi:hypothetical protein EPYR_02229 [Erwinia pyrifoliae DSM 12163]|nr:hypothetical protein EPYR_02229 [Erwinia pyrifoliae DSM 12163]
MNRNLFNRGAVVTATAVALSLKPSALIPSTSALSTGVLTMSMTAFAHAGNGKRSLRGFYEQ